MADLTSRILVVISASSGGATKELNDLQRQATKTGDSFDTIAKQAGLAGKTIKAGLVAGAAALVGTQLVGFLQDSVDAFVDGQRAAQLFSKAMNTSGENAGKLSTFLNTLGIDTNDLIEINAEFSKALAANKTDLDRLNVTLKRNANGTIDTADALVQVIDGLQGVEDGAERSQLALKFFGEEGTKQLAPLLFNSKKLSESLEEINFLYDPASAQEYAASQAQLNLAFQTLQRTIGQTLVPVLTEAARAGTDIVNFLLEIPAPVYAAVAGFVAMKAAVSFLGPALSGTFSTLATSLTGIGLAAENAGGKAGLVKKGFGNIVQAIGPWNIALAGLTVAIAAVGIGAQNSQDRLKEFVTYLDGTDESLSRTATAMLDTASAWEKFWITLTNNSEALNAGTFTRIFAEAVAAAFDKGREGGEAYEAALRNIKEEMGAAAAATTDLQVQQRSLNDAVAAFVAGDPTATWQSVTDAARAAAIAQGEVDTATRLAAEQLAIASGNLGFFVEKLRQLETFNGSGMESLKQQLIGISLVDDPNTAWVDEYKIGAEEAADAIQTKLIAALEQDPDLDPAAWFASLREGAPPQIQAIIDAVQAQFNADGGVKAVVGAEAGPTVAETQTQLDELGNPVTSTFDLSTGEGVAAAKTAKENLSQPISSTLTITSQFEPGGYSAVKARKDFLTQQANANIAIATEFGPGGYLAVKARKDFLTQQANANIAIATEFGPGGYNAVKARKDFLTNAATGSIYIDVAFGPGGYNAVKSRVDFLTTPRRTTITQVVNQVAGTTVARTSGSGNPGGRAAVQPFSPINMVRVSVDGRELRSVVDDEIRALTPTRQEVA